MSKEVKIGDKLRDNDKRKPDRVVTVTGIDGDHALYHTGKRTARVRFDRIYTDGKSRQRGFSLVTA